MLDYLIANENRHQNNFGLIRDTAQDYTVYRCDYTMSATDGKLVENVEIIVK